MQERFNQARHHRLLSPAEAVNVLTVGSTHQDRSSAEPGDTVVDGVAEGMPAPYSALGFGHRRSVKPEILIPGGRRLFVRPPEADDGTSHDLEMAYHSAIGPGIRVAAPSVMGGSSGSAFSCGTSNSAALATRAASHLFDVLENGASAEGFPFPDPQYHPVVVKTFMVHAAEWGDAATTLRHILGLDPRSWRRDLTQLLGYGPVDPERLGTAATNRAVLIGAGTIAADGRNTFSLPLPAALAATTEWRRLTITLGWLSPIVSSSRVHRQARLWFSPPDGLFGGARQQADANAVKMGTVQHEVFEGDSALAFARGATAQVHVDCRADGGAMDEPVRYGLAVSIEMAQKQSAPTFKRRSAMTSRRRSLLEPESGFADRGRASCRTVHFRRWPASDRPRRAGSPSQHSQFLRYGWGRPFGPEGSRPSASDGSRCVTSPRQPPDTGYGHEPTLGSRNGKAN